MPKLGNVQLSAGTAALDDRGHAPEFGADEALRELLEAMGDGSGAETPPPDPATTGPLRSTRAAHARRRM